ncbi:DUF433 domain-containing protein [Jongsikchunia kroppenstedtii]|uniref:DUF433 domain-containing protein n=1 Tax=Jongsikchunia kroppenstedtii TaxID=1121721 RepID=UPI000382C9E8|nr:DUF433 domain-containing protein [Jongsikchunia kroppenstedtii]
MFWVLSVSYGMLSNMPISLLDREVYLYAEVDRLIGLASGTARRWINGYTRGGRSYDPILREDARNTDWVTWGEFVETRILAEYRDQRVSTVRLRGAVEALRQQFSVRYPLAHLQPYLAADAGELTIDASHLGDSANDTRIVVRTGQMLLSRQSFSIIEHAELAVENSAKVVSQLPMDLSFPEIVINPGISSGQPTFQGRRVTAATIAGMVAAGEDRADLATDYQLTLAQIDAAVRYVAKYPAAA